MRPQRLIATFLAAIGSPVTAATGHRQFAQLSAPPLEAAQDRNDLGRRNLVTATFNQLIDHNNPGLGTFKQRYMVNDEFYAGPGSPIILNAPGEDAIDFYTGYTTNRTLPGEFAKRVSGAVVLLEHRYYGDSSPYDQLTTTNLQHLTLDNAIQDLVYFAENVRFDFDTSGTSTPNNAPWVLTGCSYSGALTAWVNAKVPGTFWAYHASSAVVQALEVLPQYFDVVAQAMPQNCSADLQRVVQYVDSVLQHGTDESKLQLRDKFGLAKLQNSDDFGAALLDGLWTWQDTEFDEGYGDFNRFCDYVENRWPGSNTSVPGPSGVGTLPAVEGMAKWFREIHIPFACDRYGLWEKGSVACYDTHNASSPLFSERRVRNTVNRQWWWMLCNEPFKWFFGRSGSTRSAYESNMVTQDYWQRQCALAFPTEGSNSFGIAHGRTTADVNKWTGGWDFVNRTRFMWSIGEFDPWKPATVVSAARPGGALRSSEAAPVRVIPGASHCGDLLQRNAASNEGVAEVYDAEANNILQWVDEWYSLHGRKRPQKAVSAVAGSGSSPK